VSVIVQIVGGPEDGAEFALGKFVAVVPTMETREPNASDLFDIEIKAMPVRLTVNGYRAYWYERS
jgi:hypothetical protein